MKGEWSVFAILVAVVVVAAIGFVVRWSLRKLFPSFRLIIRVGGQDMDRDTGFRGMGDSRSNDVETQLERVETLTRSFFIALLLLSLLYSVAYTILQSQFFGFLQPLGMLTAAIFAAAAAGGFLGFLFGIPRNLQRPVAAPPPGAEGQDGSAPSAKPALATADGRLYGTNTNLEDISDWITKIIVGLGLVQASTIMEKLWNLAGKFKEGISNAPGADVLFVLVVVAASVAGFLFCYLETRTRISLLFVGADVAADARARATTETVKSAEIADFSNAQGPPSGAAPAAPLAADQAFLNTSIDKLNTVDQMAAWAAAQARAGNFQAANTAFSQAIAKAPSDTDLKLKQADTLILQGQWRSAAAVLNEALTGKPDDPEILKRILFVSLYLPKDEGIPKALEAGPKLLANPVAAEDPNVHLWLAAAYGQQYSQLVAANADAGQKKKVRDDALAAVQRVVDYSAGPNSAPRQFLRRIFDPPREQSPPDENDLEVFKDDPEFQRAIYGAETPAVATASTVPAASTAPVSATSTTPTPPTPPTDPKP